LSRGSGELYYRKPATITSFTINTRINLFVYFFSLLSKYSWWSVSV
jgi:hypothetical protein